MDERGECSECGDRVEQKSELTEYERLPDDDCQDGEVHRIANVPVETSDDQALGRCDGRWSPDPLGDKPCECVDEDSRAASDEKDPQCSKRKPVRYGISELPTREPPRNDAGHETGCDDEENQAPNCGQWLTHVELQDSRLLPRSRWSAHRGRSAAVWLAMAAAIGCARRAPQPPSPTPAAREPVPAELRQRYVGTYVYAGGEGERAAVAAAVNRAVEDMSFLTRGFARSALIERAEIREAYTILFDDAGRVGILSPGELPEVSPPDGTPVPVVNRFGDESELTQQFIDGVLVQRGRTADGGGSTVFELQPDDQTLLVHRTMESSKLSQPVKYALTYRRQ
jgi:hypothetical protein